VQLRLLPSEASRLPRLPRPLWSVPLRFTRAALLDLLASQLRKLASSGFFPQLATVNGHELQLYAGDARVLDWSTVVALQRIRPAGCETIELRYAFSETAATGIARLALQADAQHTVAPARTVRFAPPQTAAPPHEPAPPPVAPVPPPPSRAELARAQRILDSQQRAAAVLVDTVYKQNYYAARPTRSLLPRLPCLASLFGLHRV
jgi:hypothetical protein